MRLRAEGLLRGMQVCVAQGGGRGRELQLLASACVGELGAADPRPVQPDSLFCVFSAGKAPCAAAVLQLVDEGLLRLDEQVCGRWREFGVHGKEACTVEDVLRHRAGLANALPVQADLDSLLDLDQMVRFIAQAAPDCVPGTRTAYHYLTFGWLLAGISGSVTGCQDFSEILRARITSKLGIEREMLLGVPAGVLAKENGRLASLEAGYTRDRVDHPASSGRGDSGSRTDPGPSVPWLSPLLFNMRKVRAAQVPAGNLHCSARALAKFYAGLGQGPTGGPALLLGDELLDKLTRPATTGVMSAGELNQTPDAPFGLGMQIYDFHSADGQRRVAGIGHAGIGGSVGFAIPELGIGVAVTVNRLEMAGQAPREVLALISAELGVQPPVSLVGPYAQIRQTQLVHG